MSGLVHPGIESRGQGLTNHNAPPDGCKNPLLGMGSDCSQEEDNQFVIVIFSFQKKNIKISLGDLCWSCAPPLQSTGFVVLP